MNPEIAHATAQVHQLVESLHGIMHREHDSRRNNRLNEALNALTTAAYKLEECNEPNRSA